MSERNLEEIRAEITDLKNKSAALAMEKRKLEGVLAKARDLVKAQASYMTRLPPSEFRMWQTRATKAKSAIQKIEEQLLPIKSRLRILYDEEEHSRGALMAKLDQIHSSINGQAQAPDIVRDPIVRLRDKWMIFAEDQTRVNSMRLLAAQFARELTEILSGVGHE